jgi:replicative DNA helicase
MTLELAPPFDDEQITLTPPNDLAAEIACLGGMILDRHTIDDCLDIVVGPDFYRPAHEAIFLAIAHLHFEGEPVDAITVADHLRDRGDLARVGGAAYIHHLVQSTPVAASAAYYAEIVADLSIRRRLVEAGTRIAQLGMSQGAGDSGEIIAAAQSAVDAVDARRATELVSGADALPEVLAALDSPDLAGALSTPWPSLTGYLGGGFAKGRVYVIGARPSVGKTAVALSIALWVMQRHGKSVAFSTLEMPREEIVTRLLSQMSGVPLTSGKVQDFQRVLLEQAASTLRSLPPIWVDDREQVDPAMVRSHARAAKSRSDLGLIVVDYLQLMESAGKVESRQQEVAKFSRAIKKTARALDVPILLLSQLNRQSEMRGPDAPPRLADLRDSGAVEQDADVVMLLHKPDREREDLDLRVSKNRQGPRDVLSRLTFDGARMTITERQPWPHEVGR